MPLSKTTQDHDEIRRWAEARGAQPAEVARTHSDGEAGILRFCFPNAPNRKDKALREISWDDFFEKFDENDLELVYQEKTASGQASNFNKLVHPSDEDHSSRSGSRAPKSFSRSSTSTSPSSAAKQRSSSPGNNSASHSRPARSTSRTQSAKSSSHTQSRGAASRTQSGTSGSRTQSTGGKSRTRHSSSGRRSQAA